jgi:hypothetical protein
LPLLVSASADGSLLLRGSAAEGALVNMVHLETVVKNGLAKVTGGKSGPASRFGMSSEQPFFRGSAAEGIISRQTNGLTEVDGSIHKKVHWTIKIMFCECRRAGHENGQETLSAGRSSGKMEMLYGY